MSAFESVGKILPRVVKAAKISDELLALQVRKNFETTLNLVLAGEKTPKITAGRFSYGVLTVLVPDPAFSYQLRSKEGAILKKLNFALGGKIVKKLRFRVLGKES